MQYKIWLFISVLGLLSLCACKDDDCSNGYESFDDECICPDGKFEGFGECRSLRENEYYGINTCGGYTDTVFIQFLEKGSDGVYRGRMYNGRGGYREISTGYTEYSMYDSLYSITEYWSWGLYGHRLVEGEASSAKLFGRLTDTGFTGRLEWRNINDGTLVDECPFTMER